MFLIVKTGTTLPELRARRGDFEDWIAAGMGVGPDATRVVRVDEDESLPRAGDFAGVVVTGSSAMVSEREPWSERTADWLARAVGEGAAVLGICYGHQLLAQALGGRVGPNPRGREIGSVQVRFSGHGADPLLNGAPAQRTFHATHVESVLALPEGVVSLAQSDLDPHHAFAAGARAWGVQFHPEFDADVMRGYLRGRRERLLEEGLDPDALAAGVEDADAGPALLRRFADLARSDS